MRERQRNEWSESYIEICREANREREKERERERERKKKRD